MAAHLMKQFQSTCGQAVTVQLQANFLDDELQSYAVTTVTRNWADRDAEPIAVDTTGFGVGFKEYEKAYTEFKSRVLALI
jgi:hypothetical protein